MTLSRRAILGGLIAAPAIVRVSHLMAMPRALIRPRLDSLPCNGELVAIADYPELFAVMGTAYGDAPGRFRLPDLGPSVLKPLRYRVNATPRFAMPVGMLTLGADA